MPPSPSFFTREHTIEIVLFVVAALSIWFVVSGTLSKEKQEVVSPEAPTSTETENSFGATLYRESSNPISDAPEQKPVSNPIDDAYKNPF